MHADGKHVKGQVIAFEDWLSGRSAKAAVSHPLELCLFECSQIADP